MNAIAATGVIVVTQADVTEAAIIGVGMVGAATLPDIDMKIPKVPHRGAQTHSLFSVVVMAGIAWLAYRNLHPALIDQFGRKQLDFGTVRINLGIITVITPELLDVTRFLRDYATLIAVMIGIGSFSHLIGDLFSLNGVPLLWPFVTGDVHIVPRWASYRVGGWVERTAYILTCVAIALFVTLKYGGEFFTNNSANASQASCKRPNKVKKIVFNEDKYPHIMKHTERAIDKGWPVVLVLNRPGADERRDKATAPVETKDGYDRDEYPPAVGRKTYPADVALVPTGENRSHGSKLGHKLEPFCNGTRFKYVFR